jgi:hypothetical protein
MYLMQVEEQKGAWLYGWQDGGRGGRIARIACCGVSGGSNGRERLVDGVYRLVDGDWDERCDGGGGLWGWIWWSF